MLTRQGYYPGDGTGETSWAPIMGLGYNKAVTKFNRGDYAGATNTEDDLAIVAAKLTYRTDDFGSTAATAAALSWISAP